MSNEILLLGEGERIFICRAIKFYFGPLKHQRTQSNGTSSTSHSSVYNCTFTFTMQAAEEIFNTG